MDTESDEDYEIVVVDAVDAPWPPPRALLALGVPAAIVARFALVRHCFTEGLARRGRQDRN
jgi:hypothetical protein